MTSQPQYRICPRCARAVPIESEEKYCINDGTEMTEQCQVCQAPIMSPYARNCAQCGQPLEPQAIPKKVVPKKSAIPVFSLLAVLLIAAVLWFKPASPQLEAVYIGKIPQSPVFIAIALQKQRVLAYICDGQKTAEWFKGALGLDNSLELQSKNGARLIAKINLQNALGSLELPSGTYAFAISVARDQAGFFRAEGNTKKAVAGWIVLPNGEQQAALISQVGVQKAPRLEDKKTMTALGLDLKIVNPKDPQSFPF